MDKIYAIYWDTLYGQALTIEQYKHNVYYCIYSEPIKGTITMTGSQYRAYPKKAFTTERFHFIKWTRYIPELPNDKRFAK